MWSCSVLQILVQVPVALDDPDKLQGENAIDPREPEFKASFCVHMPVVLNGEYLDKLKGEIALAIPDPESKAAFLEDVPAVLNGECRRQGNDVVAPSPKDSPSQEHR